MGKVGIEVGQMATGEEGRLMPKTGKNAEAHPTSLSRVVRPGRAGQKRGSVLTKRGVVSRQSDLIFRQRRFIPVRRRTKSPSRIPGLSVGEEAQTQDGPMKKVCFNIGGKWIFRMVDTDWVPPGRPHKGRQSKENTLNGSKS